MTGAIKQAAKVASTDPKVALTAGVVTASGPSLFPPWLGPIASEVALMVGICLTVTLIFTNWRKHFREQRLAELTEAKLLKELEDG